ncbi:hypothetical protein [Rhodoluna limnophila]|uniref:hypothetical protein n=1 Tax=Rhodoluna limnophila TaxID=232537 RepID=UPI0011071138|nr:hypothetical protein [Rhodoluna limnophila]
MNPASIAALSVAIICVFIAMFQLALALGAPMGEYAFGGQNAGKLPVGFRVASVFSLAINLAIAGHFLAQASVLPQLLPAELNVLANWGLVGFAGLGVLLNSISRSKKERQMWVPVTALILICAVIVAIG